MVAVNGTAVKGAANAAELLRQARSHEHDAVQEVGSVVTLELRRPEHSARGRSKRKPRPEAAESSAQQTHVSQLSDTRPSQRGRAAGRAPRWNPSATEDTLVRAFSWELAQALKPAFFLNPDINFNQLQKVTFLRDYTEKVPLARLRSAAIDGFAPPAQRLCVVLARLLSRLPPELGVHVLDYVPGWPKVAGQALPPARLHSLCAAHFLGPLARKAGKLTMGLPKDGAFKPPASGPRSEAAAATEMMQSAMAQRQAWWNKHPTRSFQSRRAGGTQSAEEAVATYPDCLAERIIAAEAAITARAVALALALPAPPANPANERHSLELMVKLIYDGPHRDCRSSRAFATMLVPDDASITALGGWMRELDDERRGYCYFSVEDKDAYHAESWRREERRKIDQRHPMHPLLPGEEELREHDKSESRLPPYRITVRISRIEMQDLEGGYASDDSGYGYGVVTHGHFPRARVFGSREALVDAQCAAYGQPTEYPRCDDNGSWTFAHEHHLWGRREPPAEVSAPYRSTVLDITHHVAIADVVPTPEDRNPTLVDYYSCDQCIFGLETELEWTGSRNHYEIFALRRLPQLADEQYPLIRTVNAVPRTAV